ncbi:hypothetical protein OP10G_0028 [Fimbriimonas ginsengisoli Gsoil 348]|uniref:Uncharacterized protein n=1 Tax=Fimbriimonas ginsengisoli Gsoil 348 TaxID=661478 RepID=A0A068NIN8_FIMGI|nr:hypothetical protein OP10G_0028 [Fimbriimonas ginsengisoli Gsoil 348]
MNLFQGLNAREVDGPAGSLPHFNQVFRGATGIRVPPSSNTRSVSSGESIGGVAKRSTDKSGLARFVALHA